MKQLNGIIGDELSEADILMMKAASPLSQFHGQEVFPCDEEPDSDEGIGLTEMNSTPLLEGGHCLGVCNIGKTQREEEKEVLSIFRLPSTSVVCRSA